MTRLDVQASGRVRDPECADTCVGLFAAPAYVFSSLRPRWSNPERGGAPFLSVLPLYSGSLMRLYIPNEAGRGAIVEISAPEGEFAAFAREAEEVLGTLRFTSGRR